MEMTAAGRIPPSKLTIICGGASNQVIQRLKCLEYRICFRMLRPLIFLRGSAYVGDNKDRTRRPQVCETSVIMRTHDVGPLIL
jgi:hypothetical protein